jgi:hypothetical protein
MSPTLLTAGPHPRALSQWRSPALLLATSVPTMVAAAAVVIADVGQGYRDVGDWTGYLGACLVWWASVLPVTLLLGMAFLKSTGVSEGLLGRAAAATTAAAVAGPLWWALAQNGPGWFALVAVAGACGSVKVAFAVSRRDGGVVLLLVSAFLLARVGGLAVIAVI